MIATKNIHNRLNSLFTKEELWLIENLFRRKRTVFDGDTPNEDVLLSTSSRNGITPLLYAGNLCDGFSERFRAAVKQEYLYTMGRNSAFQKIAEEIINKLSSVNIPVILLKGIHLATNVYPDIALRPMSDIDLLVPPGKAALAWQIMNGKEPDERDSDKKTAHHLPAFNYRGANIELHRYLFPSDVKYTVPVDDIWKHSEKLDRFNAFAMNPVHQIIYLLLHVYYTTRQGGFRLGWFDDITAVTGFYSDSIALSELKTACEAWRVYKPVHLMLQFYALLVPDNKLGVLLCAKSEKQIKQMIRLLHTSNQLKPEYGYGIVFERLWQTKGIRNKIVFIKNILNNKSGCSPQRIAHLFKNSFRFAVQKILRR
jgi:hypothetical protein